ncbi:MAG: hypothetical protein KME06_09460 [Kastovskya adunca ATA6-11-RM4]|jgi:hypothetical protein|nr:hypothetical protein [Kastovskya adunca ATA6-11-RM4]
MPGSFTNWAEAQILNAELGGVNWAVNSTLYFGFTLTASGEAGAGAEPVSGNMTRVAVANNLANFPAAVNGLKTVTADIQTNLATANIGSVVDLVIWDSAVAGNAVAYAQLPAAKLVQMNDGLLIPSGSITIQAQPGGFFSLLVKNAWLDHIFGGVPRQIPPTWYVGYVTGTPNDTAPGAEPIEPSYGRVAFANNTVYFPAVLPGQGKTNAQPIVWSESTGSQGLISHLIFFDDATGGNYCGRNQVPATSIDQYDIPFVAANSLSISVD